MRTAYQELESKLAAVADNIMDAIDDALTDHDEELARELGKTRDAILAAADYLTKKD